MCAAAQPPRVARGAWWGLVVGAGDGPGGGFGGGGGWGGGGGGGEEKSSWFQASLHVRQTLCQMLDPYQPLRPSPSPCEVADEEVEAQRRQVTSDRTQQRVLP